MKTIRRNLLDYLLLGVGLYYWSKPSQALLASVPGHVLQTHHRVVFGKSLIRFAQRSSLVLHPKVASAQNPPLLLQLLDVAILKLEP